MNKLYHFFAAMACVLFTVTGAQAQKINADSLVKQGLALQKANNYTEAIAKYRAALKLDPVHDDAKYRLASGLSASGDKKSAIAILDDLTKTSKTGKGRAYYLLGGIYEDMGDLQKGVDTYIAGAKADTKYYYTCYRLAEIYFRETNNLNEAEKWVIEAIKRYPVNADLFDLHGSIAYMQNKYHQAFLAYCSYLMFKPNTERSKEVLRTMGELVKVFNSEYTSLMPFNAEKELTYIFNMLGEHCEKSTQPKDFFCSSYADYFYRLAKSDNMEAFSKYLLMAYNAQTARGWIQDNKVKFDSYLNWLDANPRKF